MTSRQTKPAKVRTPYAPAISRILGRHYLRSVKGTRGAHAGQPLYGFIVSAVPGEPGTVCVSHRWGSAGVPMLRDIYDRFGKYADVLAEAGYATDFNGVDLIVTAAGTRQPATAEQIDAARSLAADHRAERRQPFGCADYVRWDAGSAELLTALGIITPTTDDNMAGREDIVNAYCDTFEGMAA